MLRIPWEISHAMKDDVDLFIELTDGKVTDRQDALIYYIFGVLGDGTGVKKMYKLLTKRKGIPRDMALKFLNHCIKLRYKIDKGSYSWWEIDKYDIPYDEVKVCSTYDLNFG